MLHDLIHVFKHIWQYGKPNVMSGSLIADQERVCTFCGLKQYRLKTVLGNCPWRTSNGY